MNLICSFRSSRGKRFSSALFFLFAICASVPAHTQAAPGKDAKGLKPILDYISSGWDTLTRSMTDCKSIVDPKISAQSVL